MMLLLATSSTRDTDRGGTDEPLDGELGLGDDDTVISGIRRRTSTLLQLNDNNNPAHSTSGPTSLREGLAMI